MKRFTLGGALGIGAVLLLVIAAAVWGPGLCRVPQKERLSGPVVVWLHAEPEAEYRLKEFIERFAAESGLEFRLEFKEEWELRPPFMNAETLAKGEVDVVEADLFSLEAAAPLMSDLNEAMAAGADFTGIYSAPWTAGVLDGRQAFVPWRLSWPAMVQSRELRGAAGSWKRLLDIIQHEPGKVLVPGLKDRELLAFVCGLIWGCGGDPNDPDGEGFQQAMEWLERARDQLDWRSDVSQAADPVTWPAEKRPGVFMAWPGQLVPLVVEAAISLYYEPAPMPCGGAECGVFFFGRFLAVPAGARHPEDGSRLIIFLTSLSVQEDIIRDMPWLPMRSDAWGQLGVRKESYEALSRQGQQLHPPPADLARMEKALPRAARMILWEEASPGRAVAAYKALMAGREIEENE